MSEKYVKPYKKGRVILDKKYSMIIYVVTLVLAVLCRTLQLKSNMDFSTGKYINDNPFLNYTVAVMIIGFVLIALTLIFGEARDKVVDSCILLNPIRIESDQLAKKVSPIAGGAMLLTAAFLAYDSLVQIMNVSLENLERSSDRNPVPMFAGISAIEWISYSLMMILMITFIITAMNVFKNIGVTPGNCFFMAIYPIWKLIHIFVMINEYQLIGPYSERCYMLFTDIFTAMFVLYMVRFFSGFEKKHTRILMIMFGYMASIVTAVSIVPRYLMFILVDYTVREGMTTPTLSDIGMIFLPVSIIAVFWSNYVYRSMPKLNIPGRNRWTGIQVDDAEVNSMKSIDE